MSVLGGAVCIRYLSHLSPQGASHASSTTQLFDNITKEVATTHIHLTRPLFSHLSHGLDIPCPQQAITSFACLGPGYAPAMAPPDQKTVANLEHLVSQLVPANEGEDERIVAERQHRCFELAKSIITKYIAPLNFS